MNMTICKNLFQIKNLRVLQQEIPKEGSEQLATMLKLFWEDIPDLIESLERLNELEGLDHGKAIDRPTRAHALRISD